MGETLLLLSCGAAFITGLVIAAASLFGSMAVGIAARLFKNSRRQGISLLNQNIASARSLARWARREFECYSRRRAMAGAKKSSKVLNCDQIFKFVKTPR
jgi:type II secretory pathway pseudopilin PulG